MTKRIATHIPRPAAGVVHESGDRNETHRQGDRPAVGRRSLSARTLGRLVATAAAALSLAAVAPTAASADHQRVVYDDASRLNPSQAVELGYTWLGTGNAISHTCVLRVVDRSWIPHGRVANWLLRYSYGDACEVGKAYGTVGYHLAYSGFYSGGASTYYRVYSMKENRRLRRDVCTTWVQVGSRWVASFTHFAPCFGE